ncbi:MAG: flagellar hook protein FlgE [Caulobacteraceae bacterium]
MNPISSAAQGMFLAQGRFTASAERLSRFGADPSVDIATEAVEQIQDKAAFKASAIAVRTADDMMGTLLDTLA